VVTRNGRKIRRAERQGVLLLFLLLAVLGFWPSAVPAGTILTQGQLNAELGTSCAAQGKQPGCITPTQMSDFIVSAIAGVGTGISAAGSNQGTATVLTNQMNTVTTVPLGAGVVLPTPVAGQDIFVSNQGANPLAVYPPSGDTIDALAANTPFMMAPGTTVEWMATSASAFSTAAQPPAGVGPSITGAATLSQSQAGGLVIPVSGSGYTITVPQSTAATLPANSFVTLAMQPGAGPVDVCPGAAAAFDAASQASLVPNICPSGQSGIVLATGILRLLSEPSGKYFAQVAAPPAAAAANPNAFIVSPTGSDSNPGTLQLPFATALKCRNAMDASSLNKTCYFRAGVYTGWAGDTSFPNQCGTTVSGAGTGDMVVLNNTVRNDNGLTFSYYPPDGPDTAIFNDQATSSTTGTSLHGFCIVNSNHDQIIGLGFINFAGSGIVDNSNVQPNGSNNFSLNYLFNSYAGGSLDGNSGAIWIDCSSPNTQIIGNLIVNVVRMGITTETVTCTSVGGINNTTVANNLILNSCSGVADCGAIYFNDQLTSTKSTGITITNNYASKTSKCWYADDGVSNATFTGNVCIGATFPACAQLHGGMNVVFTYNVCDEGGGGGSQTNFEIVFYQQSLNSATSNTGNVWVNNIITGNCSTLCGVGYFTDNGHPPNANMTVTNNWYFNYGSGTGGKSGINDTCNNSSAGCAGGVDANPSGGNPSISCLAALIAPASGVLSSPVSFQALGQAWGPFGGAIPAQYSLTMPSWGGTC
jgi:hypothetical protein